MKPLPTVPISFEEFLDWCDEDTRAEWVNGKVVLLSPDSIPHDDLADFLAMVLRIYSEERSPGRVFTRTILMKTGVIPSGRMPDLFFIAQKRAKESLKHTYVDGAADLALEIVSPESVERDEDEKFREYAKAGVREYWLINPMRREAAAFELKAGRYKKLAIEDGVIRSRVVDGFYVRIDWLWQRPSTLDVLREFKLI